MFLNNLLVDVMDAIVFDFFIFSCFVKFSILRRENRVVVVTQIFGGDEGI
jgi:hypothetical protein